MPMPAKGYILCIVCTAYGVIGTPRKVDNGPPADGTAAPAWGGRMASDFDLARAGRGARGSHR